MTMPKTALRVQAYGGITPEQLTDGQLVSLVAGLREDLSPGTIDFVEQVACQAACAGEFTYVSRSPQEMASQAAWDELVSYLARLFASPFSAIIREWARRRYDVDVAFVNCCIISAEPHKISTEKVWDLQVGMQLTPDC